MDQLLRAKYGDQHTLRPQKRPRVEVAAKATDAQVEADRAGWKRRWGGLRSRGERADDSEDVGGGKLRRAVQRSCKARRVVAEEEED